MGEMNSSTKKTPILVTGATGYVGARLILRLLEAGYRVRATSRSFKKLKTRLWAKDPNVELVDCDVLDYNSLLDALQGCKTAFYLVHSLDLNVEDFAKIDRMAAWNMRLASEVAKIDNIIYLGGLGDQNAKLSKHLQSRIEVAEIMRGGVTPVTYLRAPMILGSGSISFEILRYLTDRLPVIVAPRALRTKSQPIAIRNVLLYMIGCVENKETIGRTIDLVGPEIMSYLDLVKLYAEEAGLKKRITITLPFFTTKMASYLVHMVTPVPKHVSQPLFEGMGCDLVTEDDQVKDLIPQKLFTPREAISLALKRIDQQVIKSSWMDAGSKMVPEWVRYHDVPYAGGDIRDCWYRVVIKGSAKAVWDPISRIGGNNGWYFGNWLWELRGMIDQLFGGYGTRRGRAHPSKLKVGDALDWWRVVDVKENERLLLIAEMKIPGEATLEFTITEMDGGHTKLVEIARFMPKGLAGLLYWYSVYPFHYYIFRGMLREIAKKAKADLILGPEEIKPPEHKLIRMG
tara:strand:+ start:51487 stop:53031 length:1545 start_codon:yes stop_codon:yes gene_type:complete